MIDYHNNQSCPQCSIAGSSKKERLFVRIFEIWLQQKAVTQANIPGIGKVDAYFPDKQLTMEFHGCFWHGCSKCFDHDDINPVSNKSYRELYETTLERDNKLRQQFNHNVIWECEVEPYLQTDTADIICVNSIYSSKQLYYLAMQEMQDEFYEPSSLPTDILTDEDFRQFDLIDQMRNCEI